jgi:ribonuclease J
VHFSPPFLCTFKPPLTLAAAIAPKRLIPIHTFERDRFPELFDNVFPVDDGRWIEV